MNNVIMFPNSNKIRSVPTPQTVQEDIENLKLAHVDEALEFLNVLLMDNMIIGGFNFDFTKENKYLKDLAMVSESIRAILYKYHKIDHPLHKLSEKIFTTKNNEVDWAGEKITVRVCQKKKDNEDA